MPPRAQRGPLLQELTRVNPWWIRTTWMDSDPQIVAASRAPYVWQPNVLNDITPPNLYTLRGPRRVGKSTTLKQTIGRLLSSGIDPRRICYFAADALSSFNDLINLFQAARLLFVDLGDTPRYFFIDEVTSIPNWQQGVKWLRDNTAAASDCIVATGSSARDIGTGSRYLAGRRGPAHNLDRILLPLSFPEFVRCTGHTLPPPTPLALAAFYTEDGRTACQDALVHIGVLVDAFETYLLVGGFPQAVADFRRIGQVSDGFVRDLWDVIQADLARAGASRPEQCLRLLERISASLASPVVLRALAAELDVTHPTIGAWLAALTDAYLAFLLFKESSGVADLRGQRKVYPIDPFLARLPAHRSPGIAEPDSSRLAENALAIALFRSVQEDATGAFGLPTHLFFYRSRDGVEVDFVSLPGPLAAESKYVDDVPLRETRTMSAHFSGGLLLTRSGIDVGSGVTAIPAALFAWLLDQKG